MGPDLAADLARPRPLAADWLNDMRGIADDGTAASYQALTRMLNGKPR